MRNYITRVIILAAVALIMTLGAAAQESAPAASDPTAPHLIDLPAADGLTLRGAYFAPHADAPAVLLLHQLYTTRHSWDSLTLALMEAGYNVLAVDLRGYGKTRGSINWSQAQDDTNRWAAWLSQQPGIQSVTLIGSSMGSSLALNGCASFDPCKGAVAISPGLNYFGVSSESALTDGFPILAIYAEQDPYPSEDVPTMQELAGDAMSVITLPGRAHGIDLFRQDETLIASIVEWVKAR